MRRQWAWFARTGTAKGQLHGSYYLIVSLITLPYIVRALSFNDSRDEIDKARWSKYYGGRAAALPEVLDPEQSFWIQYCIWLFLRIVS
jgi:hypothetical protein